MGACHALELGFVFGTHDTMQMFCGSGPEADALARDMQDAWLAFARTGDPGWPAYDEARRSTMVFDAKSEVHSAPYDAERQALAALSDDALGTL